MRFAYFGCIRGGYFGRRWLGFGEGLMGGERPSSTPFDRINCVLDDDSPLGFAVILSPVGKG